MFFVHLPVRLFLSSEDKETSRGVGGGIMDSVLASHTAALGLNLSSGIFFADSDVAELIDYTLLIK